MQTSTYASLASLLSSRAGSLRALGAPLLLALSISACTGLGEGPAPNTSEISARLRVLESAELDSRMSSIELANLPSRLILLEATNPGVRLAALENADFGGRLDTLEGAGLVGRMAAVETQLSIVNTSLSSMGTNLTSLASTQSQQSGTIGANSAAVAANSVDVAANSTAVAAHSAALAANATELFTLDGELIALNSEVQAVTNNLLTLGGDVTANDDAIASLGTDLASVEDEVAANVPLRTTLSYTGAQQRNANSVFSQLRVVGTFTKAEDDTDIQLTWVSHVRTGHHGCNFQPRIDGQSGGNGSGAVVSVEGEETAVAVPQTYSGLSAGTHTVSLWVRGLGPHSGGCYENSASGFPSFTANVYIEEEAAN